MSERQPGSTLNTHTICHTTAQTLVQHSTPTIHSFSQNWHNGLKVSIKTTVGTSGEITFPNSPPGLRWRVSLRCSNPKESLQIISLL